MLSYFQAIVMGLIQGVTELFPVSSLGHTVVLPQLFGWHGVVKAQSAKESYWLAFIVGLHVATALALIVFYRKDWVRIISAFFRSIADRRIDTPDKRLAWLLVVATIPAGLAGLLLEHVFRVVFAKPEAASIFLIVNGGILLLGERARRVSHAREERRARQAPALAASGAGDAGESGGGAMHSRELATLQFREAGVIGTAQILALLAGISRSGITIVAGLMRGMNHEDSARFSFLLATPIILAAGVYKIPDLTGANGNGVRTQALVGSAVAFVAAYLSVRFLTRYFHTNNLLPFALYCLGAGAALAVYFAL